MAAAAIVELPAELLLSIFEAEHTMRDTLCLSSTCKRFRSLWMQHHVRITNYVLPREILGYDDALALAKAQAEFRPSRYHRRIDAAQSELLSLTTEFEDGSSSAKRNEESREIQHDGQKRSSLQRAKEAEDIVNIYIDMQSLVGDGGQTDGYQLHLRHLRRIHRNSRQAFAIAELSNGSELRSYARQPRMSKSRKDPYLYHPSKRSLPHEDERAIQCVYHIRLRVLGEFDSGLAQRCQESEIAMPPRKFHAIRNVFSYVMSTHRKKEARILGIHRPLGFTAGAKDLTPEWRRAEWRMAELYPKIILPHESDDTIYMGGLSKVLDRCTVGDDGTRGFCTGIGARRDLWDPSS